MNSLGFTRSNKRLVVAAVVVAAVAAGIIYSHSTKSDSTIILQRQQYIDKYVSNITAPSYGSLGSALYNGGYLTSSFYQTVQSLISDFTTGNFSSNQTYSKLICVREIPNAYTYGTVNLSTSNDTATLLVNVFVPGSINPTPYTTYWVNNNGTWQLNNAQCTVSDNS